MPKAPKTHSRYGFNTWIFVSWRPAGAIFLLDAPFGRVFFFFFFFFSSFPSLFLFFSLLLFPLLVAVATPKKSRKRGRFPCCDPFLKRRKGRGSGKGDREGVHRCENPPLTEKHHPAHHPPFLCEQAPLPSLHFPLCTCVSQRHSSTALRHF